MKKMFLTFALLFSVCVFANDNFPEVYIYSYQYDDYKIGYFDYRLSGSFPFRSVTSDEFLNGRNMNPKSPIKTYQLFTRSTQFRNNEFSTGDLKAYSRQYRFDEAGNLVEVVPNNDYEKFEFEYSGNGYLLTQTYYKRGSIEKLVRYERGDNGNLLGETTYNSRGAPYLFTTYGITDTTATRSSKSQSGTSISETNYFPSGELRQHTYTTSQDDKYEFEFNVDGQIIRFRHNSKYNLRDFSKTFLTYKDSVLHSKEEFWGDTDGGYLAYKTTHNQYGHIETEEAFNNSGGRYQVTECEYDYDTYNNWTKRTCIPSSYRFGEWQPNYEQVSIFERQITYYNLTEEQQLARETNVNIDQIYSDVNFEDVYFNPAVCQYLTKVEDEISKVRKATSKVNSQLKKQISASRDVVDELYSIPDYDDIPNINSLIADFNEVSRIGDTIQINNAGNARSVLPGILDSLRNTTNELGSATNCQ